jgi:hypothetical protein
VVNAESVERRLFNAFAPHPWLKAFAPGWGERGALLRIYDICRFAALNTHGVIALDRRRRINRLAGDLFFQMAKRVFLSLAEAATRVAIVISTEAAAYFSPLRREA